MTLPHPSKPPVNPPGIPPRGSPIASTRLRECSAMDVTDEYTAQNLSARQRDVMKLIVRGLSNKEWPSVWSVTSAS